MSDESPQPVVQLTSLLTSGYLPAFAIPLLLLSLILAFAGAFLTLDRTRTFAPRPDAIESIPGSWTGRVKPKTFGWFLGGGVGGLAAGYTFGVHATTFLGLLIMNNTNSSPLGTVTFLIVWSIPALFTTVLAGRFKYVALVCIGISGGATLSLALCIMLHPALLTRVVLMSIITSLSLILAVLPVARTQHAAIRTLASAVGAFGAVLSIALLAHPQILSWANAWDRLWTSNSLEWGTAAERGLDVAFCAFWGAGAACDWLLKRAFGEDPDEKWDAYLADYASNLPNRAGNFQPLQTWWDKVVGTLFPSKDSKVKPHHVPILFPTDDMLKPTTSLTHPTKEDLEIRLPDTVTPYPLPYSPHTPSRPVLSKARPSFDLSSTPPPMPMLMNKLPKRRKAPRTTSSNKRSGVQFRPLNGYSSSSDSDSGSDEDKDVLKTPGTPKGTKPWPRVRHTLERRDTGLSGTTLRHLDSERDLSSLGGADIDVKAEMVKIGAAKMQMGIDSQPEYSDLEDEDVIARTAPRSQRNTPGWQPDFIRAASQTTSDGKPITHPTTPSPPPGAVPVTPSLIGALNRIAAAQGEAFGNAAVVTSGDTSSPAIPEPVGDAPLPQPSRAAPPLSLPSTVDKPTHGKKRWEAFWKEVTAKASTGIAKV
ncbi:hypothetical protein BD410DRAFT_839101 [Rickenella mellea]|uniref:DUF4203 domain-containing protein n=1 Tax=Rickenella mellea TaxID=50990 RepID=A0A4Y7Q6B2_9AGAM|nr:hypothetical protein BD410DRAFT_839101 [Rickenella mellea]